jgi:two-component system sensor histidine kinase KdpD
MNVARRGRLRVYLGAAPGVGKTVALLAEGVRAMRRGRDVVLAGFDAHGRCRTTEFAAPLLASAPVGSSPERVDFDLEKTLDRHPHLALVDELAFRNGPGATHPDRWQDVAALLDAGIDVVTTLDISELESLSDVAVEITGTHPASTVPDAFVRAAEQIELVDMTPEALRRRLAHGNVFPPELVDVTLANRFRVENLAALRQLSLLWLADRVEESLQRFRDGSPRVADWETKERVVVGITGAPGSEVIVRRAARIAERSRAELLGIHVRSDSRFLPSALVEHRALLEQVGGTYREVADVDVARALVAEARAEGATQLVLGASRAHSVFGARRHPLVRDVLDAAGDALDVHIISTRADDVAEGQGLPRRLPAVRRRASHLSRRRQLTGLALTAVGLPALTFVLLTLHEHLGFTSTALCYLLAVVLAATVGGVWPAALAALAGFGLLNFYFADPVRTFTIANNHDVVALVAFLVVAGVTSVLVDIAARRAAEATRARSEAEALAWMAGSLLREGDPLPQLLDNIVRLFGLAGASVVSADSAQIAAVAGAAPPEVPGPDVVSFELGPHAMLLLAGGELTTLDRSVVRAFADQVALALESRRLHAEASASASLAHANELRSALLAAVSHDLRTPLAAIKASASSLRSGDVEFSDADEQALLKTIDDEADRLNDLVGNLLDMSRIQTGALVVQPRPVSLEEVVSGALGGLEPKLGRVRLVLPDDLPLVDADPALLERALANLVDNALSWAPADTTIVLEAAAVGARVDIRVVDRGPGIDPRDRDRVFLPFQRLGDSPNGAGVGLGLALARGFVEAMRGEITVEDTPGGGTTMTVSVRPASA